MTEETKELVARLRQQVSHVAKGGDISPRVAASFYAQAADLIEHLTADRERSVGEWQPIETASSRESGGRFSNWTTADLAAQARMQAREQLDPEYTQFMFAVAGRLGAVAKNGCRVCDGTGWVCENHRSRPWDGESPRIDACGCGAGAPCSACHGAPIRVATSNKATPPLPNPGDALSDHLFGQGDT